MIRLIWTLILIQSLTACAGHDSLTSEQRQLQDASDAAVAGTLFEHELDSVASYHVHKNGFVVIKFADGVPEERYTALVDSLRANTRVKGVRAEQNGVEVCPLRNRTNPIVGWVHG